MDHRLPEEIMEEEEEVSAQWPGSWSDGYSEEPNQSLQKDEMLGMDPFEVTEADLAQTSREAKHSHPSLGEEYPMVGECVYVQWVEEEASEEAPGWYFGTVDSLTEDGNFLIIYADNATEVLDLTKVNFVLAKPGAKFYVPSKPKSYKNRGKISGIKPGKGKKSTRKPVPLDTAPEDEEDTEESSRDIIRKVLREYEEEQEAVRQHKQHDEDEYPEKRPEEMYPEKRQEEMYPEKRQEEMYPEKRQEEMYSEKRQEEIYPEKRPQEIYPEKRPKEMYPEKRPEEMYSNKRPEKIYPEKRQEEMYPEKGVEKTMYPEKRAEDMYPETDDLRSAPQTMEPRNQEELGNEISEDEQEDNMVIEEEVAHMQTEDVSAPLEAESLRQSERQTDSMRYIESGNIIIPTSLAARHPQSQIILVQRGPNGELEEVTQTEELQVDESAIEDPSEPQLPLATIIEETTEVSGVEGVVIEEELEFEVEPVGEEPVDDDDEDDSATEVVYPDDEEEEEEGDDRHAAIDIHNKMRRPYDGEEEVVVDRNGNQVVQRRNVHLVRRMPTEQYMPPHSSDPVERYDGRVISSEQMMMTGQGEFSGETVRRRQPYQTSSPQGDVENYQQMGYQDEEHAEDLERLQGRLITEEAMNMLDDKGGEGDDDEYSGDDDQDPRMPRRRGKYVRKTPEELDQVPRPWQCEFCPRAFPNKYHLQIHLRTHTGEKPYRCTECDMAFSHSSNLCSHIRTHNGIKPYKCKHCGKEFGRSNNMKAHTRIHTGEKPFECRFCGKAFRFGNHLTIHERSHTGERPYKCTYCARAFRNSSNLRTHERLHTDERPYRCRYCDRAFSGSGNLHAHERVHTGERPFQCDVCQKAFSQSSTLRIHQRIHTGDKRYQCSLCGRRFIQSNHLKTHLRRMHHIDDSLPTIRAMHKSDPYGMQPLNPNNFRVVTKQEEHADQYERDMHNKPTMLKVGKQERVDSMRPSPLVVDDDVRAKTWGPGSPLLHGEEENDHRN